MDQATRYVRVPTGTKLQVAATPSAATDAVRKSDLEGLYSQIFNGFTNAISADLIIAGAIIPTATKYKALKIYASAIGTVPTGANLVITFYQLADGGVSPGTSLGTITVLSSTNGGSSGLVASTDIADVTFALKDMAYFKVTTVNTGFTDVIVSCDVNLV